MSVAVKSSKQLEDVVELAWLRVVQALEEGKITLDNGKELVLEADQIIDLAQKISAIKVKKPQLITPPEDYEIKPTIDEDD